MPDLRHRRQRPRFTDLTTGYPNLRTQPRPKTASALGLKYSELGKDRAVDQQGKHMDTAITYLAPFTSFRISKAESQVFEFGIRLIFCSARKFELQKYDPDLLLFLRGLSGMSQKLQAAQGAKSHRLHLDALGLSVLMFAARILRKKTKLDYISSVWWPRKWTCAGSWSNSKSTGSAPSDCG